MDRWIVILEDRGDGEAALLRKQHHAEHFSYLQKNFDRIVFSCGLSRAAGSSDAFGGLWFVEAHSKEDVSRLVDEDPYLKRGLRGRIDIFKASEGYI